MHTRNSAMSNSASLVENLSARWVQLDWRRSIAARRNSSNAGSVKETSQKDSFTIVGVKSPSRRRHCEECAPMTDDIVSSCTWHDNPNI